MDAVIEEIGEDILCRSPANARELRIEGKDAILQLQHWARSYDAAIRRVNNVVRNRDLLEIGQQIFRWIDANGWASAWAGAAGPRSLTLQVDDPNQPLAQALLDAPWELLATKDGHLADERVQLFEMARRVGRAGTPVKPEYNNLQVLFMAAAPEHQVELDFEKEEALILEATVKLPLQLVVEESGTARFLRERLTQDGPFEALHLSCHADIHPERGPFLALEDEAGAPQSADVGDVVRCLGDEHQKPRLVFLSACRTAEQMSAAGNGRSSESFVRALIRAGTANVLGWDGSVYDKDAASFAAAFYGELASGASVVYAAAAARLRLRLEAMNDPSRDNHWHLARLYLGQQGGGELIDKDCSEEHSLPGAQYEEQFLDTERKQVPVARRLEFVGRRRPAQAVLRALRDSSKGVLIHGMGNLGKSSLAARIASRATSLETVVVFQSYDALTVFDRVLRAIPAAQRATARSTWRELVKTDPVALGDALEALLVEELKNTPILLIVDDLERILEPPSPEHGVTTPMQDKYRTTYAAVLGAFARARTKSRLLLTSRYRFTLLDDRGRDLAQQLTCVHVPPMKPIEQDKQWWAWLRATANTATIDDSGYELARRAIAVAQGNPGLQAALTRPLLRGERSVAEKALETIQHFQEHGVPPEAIRELIEAGAANDEDNAMFAFFKRMAFDTYRAALSAPQVTMLTAACVFSGGLPVPRPAVEAAGAAAGVGGSAAATAALDRLLALGLADHYGVAYGLTYVAANPLARPLITPFDSTQLQRVAAAAVPELAKAWRDAEGLFAVRPGAVEVTRLGLVAATVDAATLGVAASSAGRYIFSIEHSAERAITEVVRPAVERLREMGQSPPIRLLLVMFDCAELLGRVDISQQAMQLMALAGGTPDERSSALLRLARYKAKTDPAAAESMFREAAEIFKAEGDERARAIAEGGIADTLQARGRLDEALRIRTEEELPVYERLGDVRSKAVTQGQIAEILQARGKLDEALRIRVEEELPVYERIGDVRSKATTQGQIADILYARGQFDEALRIRVEEELPVYERLGDVRSKAMTQGRIADILQARGELDEALRIRVEEELPVYERLEDVRSKAVTHGQIADILQARGQLDEALRIRIEEELPVYERLGDVRSKAASQGKIADVLHARGQLDEALRIRTEEELPVYERLGDVRSKAMTHGRIADIMYARGQLDEALRIRKEEELPVYERLGDVRSKAVTQGQIADILQARGQLDEALRIRVEEELPVYTRLGDIRSKAMTQGRIADIMYARGQFDEALRIRKEEELPVYERLGDVRSTATTHGQIADILQVRGQFDEALRIRVEETLPVYERVGDVRSKMVAQGKIAEILHAKGQSEEALALHQSRLPVARQLQDMDSLAHIKFSISAIRVLRGDHKNGAAQEIFEDLTEAFTISLHLGRPDFVGAVGVLLAPLMALGGLKEESRPVLDHAERAFEALGDADNAAEVRKIREEIFGE